MEREKGVPAWSGRVDVANWPRECLTRCEIRRVRGQSTVEYALVGALVVIAAAGALTVLGTEVGAVFGNISNTLRRRPRRTDGSSSVRHGTRFARRRTGAGRNGARAAYRGHPVAWIAPGGAVRARPRCPCRPVQEGARLAAEDGRALDEGLSRAQSLVFAGMGHALEPLHLQAVADDQVVVLLSAERRTAA